MSTKIASQLPKSARNGLDTIAQELIDAPDTTRYIVAAVSTGEIKTDMDTGEMTATVRVRAIEPMTSELDAKQAKQLLERSYQRRTEGDTIPFPAAADLD